MDAKMKPMMARLATHQTTPISTFRSQVVTVYCVYCTLYTVHCTLYTVVYTAHYTQTSSSQVVSPSFRPRTYSRHPLGGWGERLLLEYTPTTQHVHYNNHFYKSNICR